MNMINFKLLKKLRKEKKLTQADVAKKINKSQQAYAFYENGSFEPDIETIKKLASIFAININELLDYTKEDNLSDINYDKNTIVLFGRGVGKKEIEVTDDEMKLINDLIKTLKKNPKDYDI